MMTAEAQTHYPTTDGPKPKERFYTLLVIVDNEIGMMSRISGLLSARGYNIQTVTAAEVNHAKHLSRISIVTKATPDVIDQIVAQLEKLIPVHFVRNLTDEGNAVERELAVIKLRYNETYKEKIDAIAAGYNTRILEQFEDVIIMEISAATARVEEFISSVPKRAIIDLSRSGVVATTRDGKAIVKIED